MSAGVGERAREAGAAGGAGPGGANVAWDLPEPFTMAREVRADDVDAFGHVNNAVYLTWLEAAAWAHSEALGVSQADCVALDRGMVAARTDIIYAASARAGDALMVGTWTVTPNPRLYSDRRYQIVRPADGVTVTRARTRFVSAVLSTGKPSRPPPQFAVYDARPDVVAALENAPWKGWSE